MDAFLALANSPFACRSQLDIEDADAGDFYGSDGEAINEDHTLFQEGADCGRASGRYIPADQLRGRRIAPNR